MPAIETLKAAAVAAIDARRGWLIEIADKILHTPELGFQEHETSLLISEKLTQLGIKHERGIALTGLKGQIKTDRSGPTVAIIGEMDALTVPEHRSYNPNTGAAHACGHHCQPATMIGAAVGLMVPEVKAELAGGVSFMAVPAEEFIDMESRWLLRQDGKLGFLSGKQEFIRLGAFDDVDMSMMVHTSASGSEVKFSIGGTSNGHLGKYVNFIGKSSHAGSLPHLGVNALQAAMLSLNALNTQRETFKNEDVVRLHGVMTAGGDVANSIPSDVRYEGRVRASNHEAILDASQKMDRCLRAGALALGSKVQIVTIPGYLPILQDETMAKTFQANAEWLVGKSRFKAYPWSEIRGGSTDMGDLSQIMPVIHPYSAGATGIGHSANYYVNDYEDAVILPAKALAMTTIDLLANKASGAELVLAKNSAVMTREEYLRYQISRFRNEIYEAA